MDDTGRFNSMERSLCLRKKMEKYMQRVGWQDSTSIEKQIL